MPCGLHSLALLEGGQGEGVNRGPKGTEGGFRSLAMATWAWNAWNAWNGAQVLVLERVKLGQSIGTSGCRGLRRRGGRDSEWRLRHCLGTQQLRGRVDHGRGYNSSCQLRGAYPTAEKLVGGLQRQEKEPGRRRVIMLRRAESSWADRSLNDFFTVRRPFGIRANAGSAAMSGSPPISGSRTVVAKEEEGIPKGNMGAKEIISTDPPRGTRDFPPEDMRMRTWLFDNFREVSRLCAFEEVDFPVVESEELYTRKAGEEIVGQLYNFEDKGGRKVALRPELTPSLARLVLQKGRAQSFPLKWFAIGQCWRYERMTRGRRREHYQWNMDIIGVPGVEAEAELLSAIVMFFTRVGITSKDVGIKVSNRKVLQAVLEKYGIQPDSFAAVCVSVDKLEKLKREEIVCELDKVGVPAEAIEGILQALTLQSFDNLEALLGADSGAVTELKQLFALAESYGIQDWLHFDASVVRGLAYYTGTVFEGFAKNSQLRAICGGGRYDRLLSTYGGQDTPACGFGFGDAVIVELLKDKKLLPQFPHMVDDIVMALDDSLKVPAAGVAARLRNAGRVVELVIEKSRKMKWVFKQCDTLKAKRLILLGTTEWEQGKVSVKDLSVREQTLKTVDELIAIS